MPYDAFDVTFCRYLLEHVTSAADTAREMVRITKPVEDDIVLISARVRP